MSLGTKLFARRGAVAALGIAILFGSGLRAEPQSGITSNVSNGSGSSSLVGTWRVTVMFVDCSTRAPLAGPFYSILSFAAGGTMGGATANPLFLAGQRSPDFGIWRRTDWKTYAAIDEALIVFTGGPFTAGVQTLTHNITLAQDGNTFTDDATNQFADFSGNPVFPPAGCSSAAGTRVQ
jgi:hypothetical protein